MKKNIFLLKRKTEVNYNRLLNFRSKLRISLPSFPFESTVESASNRMIDIIDYKNVTIFSLMSDKNNKLFYPIVNNWKSTYIF